MNTQPDQDEDTDEPRLAELMKGTTAKVDAEIRAGSRDGWIREGASLVWYSRGKRYGARRSSS